jgi:hypothetical protein
LADGHPALRDGISSKFHAVPFAARKAAPLFENGDDFVRS